MINLPYAESIHPTGSSYTCNPPILNTDRDYIVLTHNLDDLDVLLHQWGFKTGGKDYELDEFTSYKCDNINYIVTDNPKWYAKMVTATRLAKKLNLLDKQQRIDLFDFVIYGEI